MIVTLPTQRTRLDHIYAPRDGSMGAGSGTEVYVDSYTAAP